MGSDNLSRGVSHVLAAGRLKGASGRCASVIRLYWLLWELGDSGIYPGTTELANVIGAVRTTVWRAEQELAQSGLVAFTSNDRGKRMYQIQPVEPPTDTQRRLLSGPGESNPELVPQAAAKAKATLTDEVKAWAVSSLDAMTLYLRFGVNAFGKTPAECEASIRPSPNDWLVHKPADPLFPFPQDMPISAKQLMGYYWHGVSRWRAYHKIELTLPEWGRLGKELLRASETMTSWRLYCRLFATINHFDLIRWRIGGVIGATLILDESTLNHKLVTLQAMLIAGQPADWINAEYDRMNTGQRPTEIKTTSEE